VTGFEIPHRGYLEKKENILRGICSGLANTIALPQDNREGDIFSCNISVYLKTASIYN